MAFKISRAAAVESAMNSMITEGFIFTEEEKKVSIEMTDIDTYINNRLLKLKKEKPEIFTDEV